ncbi:MAG TPA: hypothetical protein VFN19_08315 [Candidatus Nanopelagicales bacterium]|nr:hypothetical protein [Candidatus Nanopelagicales bacterium]
MNSELLHTRIGAVGLVLGALTFGVGDLLRRTVEPDSPTGLTLTAAAKEHPATWLAAALLVLSASFLIVPGTVAAARWVHGRGERLTALGAYLLAGGMIASVLHVAGYYGLYAILAGSDADPAAITSIDAQSESYPLFVLGIIGFVVGTMLGTILLSIGLRRARRVPIWVPFAAVVFVVAGTVSGVPAGVVGLLAALGSLATIGVGILRDPTPAPRSAPAPETDAVTS